MSEAEEFDDEGTLVEEGVFKIDRRRALDKLMRYQLPDPAMFVLMLVRCAVASGATGISFEQKQSGTGFVVRFNGEPFTADSLRYPYASLFSRATRGVRRDRQLAIAILSLLRLKPKWITVRSGIGKSRHLLRVSSITEESLDASIDGEEETILTVAGTPLTKASEELLRARCRLSPIPITFGWKALPRTQLQVSDRKRFVFDKDGVRGWLEIPEKVGPQSLLRASRYGVFVSNVRYRFPIGQVQGGFNADGLTVSASQFGLVRNARYKKAMAAVGRQLGDFTEREIKCQGQSIPRLRELLSVAAGRRRWSKLLTAIGGKKEGGGLLSWFGDIVSTLPMSPEDELFLKEFARRTVWLREAARRLCLNESEKGPAELRDRLWGAPLFFSSELHSLSFKEIEAQHLRIGYVPTTKTARPDLKTAFQALWLAGPGEEELIERFFPTASSDVSDLLDREDRLSGQGLRDRVRGKSAPKLERLGFASLLARVPLERSGLSGEAALPFHRTPNGARINLFDLGKPHSYLDLPGRLHYAVAVEGETHALRREISHAPKEIPSALRPEILSLYHRAAEDYEIKQQGEPRQDSLRAHLLDFLVWAAEAGAALFKEHAWIARMPLFVQQGRVSWSYERLFKAYTDGETLFFAPSGNQARGFPGSLLFVGEQLTEDVLIALFPGCSLKHFPGRSHVLMLYESPKREGAVASVTIGGGRFDAAPGVGRGGQAVESPFGPFRIFGEASALSGVDHSVGARLVSGLLRENGSMGREPDSPLRQWLLHAVGVLYGPWPGKAFESEDLRHAMELLFEFPFFRRASGDPWTIGELHARFGRDFPIGVNEISLDDAESRLVFALWPKDAPRLLGKSKLPRGAPKAAAKKNKIDGPFEDLTRPPTPPKPQKDRPTLSFSTPMVFERELAAEGLRVLIGLPPELLPGLTVIVQRDGKSRRYSLQPKGLSAAATLYVDAEEWEAAIEAGAGRLDPRFEKVILSVYNRFLYGLLDMLPGADVYSYNYDSILLYLLYHLRGDTRTARSEGPGWSPLRQRIRALPLVPLLGGGRASIDALAEGAAASGELVYAQDRAVDRGEDADAVPVLRHPRLAGRILGGVKLRLYKRVPKSPQRIEREAATLAEVTPDERRVRRFIGIFQALSGRRGLDFESFPKPDSFELVESRSKRVLPEPPGGPLKVNRSHRLISQVLAAALSPEEQADYLSSLVYSDANRAQRGITDLEDFRFQSALAYNADGRGDPQRARQPV